MTENQNGNPRIEYFNFNIDLRDPEQKSSLDGLNKYLLGSLRDEKTLRREFNGENGTTPESNNFAILYRNETVIKRNLLFMPKRANLEMLVEGTTEQLSDLHNYLAGLNLSLQRTGRVSEATFSFSVEFWDEEDRTSDAETLTTLSDRLSLDADIRKTPDICLYASMGGPVKAVLSAKELITQENYLATDLQSPKISFHYC